MTTPRVCLQCGANHYAKDLCQRCYAAKRREKHPEHARAANRKYKEGHREQVRVRYRAWYQAHSEEKLARVAAYAATHRDEIRVRARERQQGLKQEPPPRLTSDSFQKRRQPQIG